jgi:hypothetical protein
MKLSKKYFWIANRLQTEKLQALDDLHINLSERDLYNLNIGNRGDSLFLGYYSEGGIKLALSKYGALKKLSKKGFKNVIMNIDTSDPYRHRLVFYDGDKKHDKMIVELVVRKNYFPINMPFQSELEGKSYLGLVIDWLCVQDIYAEFSEKKPQLPGQHYPGLGLSSIIVELLMIVCWRLNLAALINVPEHYHNAFWYSKIFVYIDPDIQAKFMALKAKFKRYPIDKISWGIEGGCLIDCNTNKPLEWKISQQILPLDKELKSVFLGKEYNHYVKQKMKEYNFTFDEERYGYYRKNLTKENMEKCI